MKKNLKFIERLTQELDLLEKLIDTEQLEDYGRIGAEQEFCVLDNNFRANPINRKILKEIQNEGFVTEIAKFNMELNVEPLDINKSCLRNLEKTLLKKMQLVNNCAEKHDAKVILTGILPTVRKHDLRFENITPNPRYFELCESINKIRGKNYKLRIRGVDELVFEHDSPLVEGCNTGYQFHLQIGPKDFSRMYNISQLISGPVLAVSTNSPILFGKRLWHETRIAVFQQSTDTRVIGSYHPGTLPRVTFGNRWVDKSIIEIFKEDIIRYKILLKSLTKIKKLNSKQPKLDALSLHNSTVYRWNRPCYGIYKGKPSLRIESRMFPAGPTIIDEVANSAFWLGLMIFYKESEISNISEIMEFDDAQTNFYSAAQQGIDATFKWYNGKRIDARKLILNDLIPKAAIGLSSININPKDIDRYLNIIKERALKRQTGSRWMIDSFDLLSKKISNQNALSSITSEIIENQKNNIPVHKWELAKNSILINNPSNLLVEECMDRYIYSILEDEPFSLALKINEWKKHNYIIVVNINGKITGELTQKILEKKNNIKRKNEILVKDLMIKNPITIRPNEKISTALKLMKKNETHMLPVVENDLFIGMLQKKLLLQYEFDSPKLISKQKILKNEDRIIGNYHSGEKGKTIIFMCGIHGNELSGKKALKKVFNYLEKKSIEISGNIIAIQGNLKAIEKKERFIDIDLNRIWKQKIVNQIKKEKISTKQEHKELKKIHEILDVIINDKKKKNIIIIDLHNTSSTNGLFTIINNENEHNIASAIKIPIITKLFSKVKGSFSEYYNSKGITSIVFEGGTIGDPASVHNHEMGIFRILKKCKIIKNEDVPNSIAEKINIAKKCKTYKVKYIHQITKSDNFIMKPNVINFQKIKKGDLLAYDKNGEILSKYDGRILMPLYQEQGNEGFYIVQNEK